MTSIVWFRQDLRLADNPALAQAAQQGDVVPVFILDEAEALGASPALGGAGRWWLHHSLKALGDDLGGLVLLRGDPAEQLARVIEAAGATAVYWNRCYEPHGIDRDTKIKAGLTAQGIEATSFKAALLHEPWQLETKTGGPFKVYSPFWRAALTREVEAPLPRPSETKLADCSLGESLEDFDLLPTAPNWAEGWEDLWQPGEAGARDRLEEFLEEGLKGYGTLRNRPDLLNVSRLSPHLHFGEISPRQIWARTRFFEEDRPEVSKDAGKFLSEVGWREFSYHLLYHFPTLPEKNWRPAFDNYPWRESEEDLKAWQRGMTGYPIVDAGMRELWQTGYMHNRVRMVVASFLIKHLRLHWKHGEAWFRDTLLDADLANNSASWQWVAGSGADAAPYFRIFNPMTQGSKFDPDGIYVRRFCPELSKLDNKAIHAPFELTEIELAAAGLKLGRDYPRPIVDHAQARAAALAGYNDVKASSESAA
ncbi:cryptochrome/photolyase family protein [Denitrobaculum tricleocarpae]|uniref:Deoxyribodipyrimidine photo-lyase n=1 Tax=Denitrobaculum tricleocarpae TaxID=2591009 RepID=A0A545TF71_9PROT|nr:deoxyribodipyrimidine photo-lyase [Denitrobaculum tricleocarpae]TQV75877.1 deoxyribodipyrimidine photo-lyase [Denitrobaculum tricleocarpae]